jgi:hypothetical protein
LLVIFSIIITVLLIYFEVVAKRAQKERKHTRVSCDRIYTVAPSAPPEDLV